MQDRLLNAYLAGTVDEAAFSAKTNELKAEAAKAGEALALVGDATPARVETALVLFDWSQRAADLWHGSNNSIRREILDSVCLNRTLSDVSLVTTKRKPFDVFAERPFLENSRGDRRLTFPNDLTGTGLLWTVLSQTFEFTADTFIAMAEQIEQS